MQVFQVSCCILAKVENSAESCSSPWVGTAWLGNTLGCCGCQAGLSGSCGPGAGLADGVGSRGGR